MLQNVFIIGATGNVGKETVSQIFKKDADGSTHKNPTRMAGMASSTDYIYDKNGISESDGNAFTHRMIRGTRYFNYESLLRVAENGTNKEKHVFIDATSAGEEMLDFHVKIIKDTNHGIVTANKNPLTICSFDEFKFLTNEPRRYGFSCSVMAGSEVVNLIRYFRDVRDPILDISGILSGTNNYVASGIESGKILSEMVFEAWNNKYTEPHPGADLNGNDVVKKILILARTSGFDIKKEKISVIPFVSSKYLRTEDIQSFLINLKSLDFEFKEKFLKTKQTGNTLRYLASCMMLSPFKENPSIVVGLTEVPLHSEFGLVTGRGNIVTVRTRNYNESGYSIIAKGTGVEITAQNIRRDLLDQLDGRQTNPK